MQRYLNRREQVAYCRERGLKITKSFLEKLACKGGGPEYQIWGNQAVSTPEQMDAWIESRLTEPHKSTSEVRAKVEIASPVSLEQ